MGKFISLVFWFNEYEFLNLFVETTLVSETYFFITKNVNKKKENINKKFLIFLSLHAIRCIYT